MADNTTNRAYLQYISAAINDFDKIYSKLVDKGVADAWGTPDANGKYNTGIATSEYASRISNLYAIKDKNGNFVTPSDSYVSLLDAVTLSTATVNTQTGVITFTGVSEGFVNGSTSFSKTLTPESATIADFTPVPSTTEGVKDKYVYTPEGVIVKDVTIEKGSIALDANALVHTKTATSGVVNAATVSSSDISSTVLGTEFDTDAQGQKVNYSATDYVSLTINPTFAVGCGHTITIGDGTGYSFESGYITSAELSVANATKTITESSTITDQNVTVYLKKAALENVSATGNIAFTGSEIGSDSASTYTQYYTIAAKAGLRVNGTITAGYIDAGTTLGSSNEDGDEISSTFYVKKTAIADVALSATEYKANITGNGSVATVGDSEVSGAYNIAVTVPALNKSVTAEEGYILGDDRTFAITGTGSTQYVSIAKGNLEAVSSASLKNIGSVAGFTKTTPSGDSAETYTEIPLTLASSNNITEGGFTAGYITSEEYSVTAGADVNTSIYVQNQRTTQRQLNIVVNSVDKGSDGQLIKTPIEIFTQAPTKIDKGIDYYEIEANSILALSAGYSSSSRNEDQTKAVYLPKATLKYIDNGEDGNLIEVETGGYLPAGLLTDISEITGTLDKAAVYTSLNGALQNVNGVSKYVVTATYNGSDSSAGYFDPATSFHGASFEIAAGSVETTASVTGVSFVSATKKDDTAYTVTVNAAGKVNTDIAAGYIQESDLLVNDEEGKEGADVAFNANTTFEIAKAAITGDANDNDVDVVATPTGFAFDGEDSDSPYKITVDLGADTTIKAKASTGYIAAADSEVDLTVTTTAVEYTLKAATVGAISVVEGQKVTIETNLTDNVEGDYTVKLANGSAVNAQATIGEGYTAGAVATGSVAVAADTVTIAHGTLGAAVASKQNVIEAKTTGLTVHATAAEAGEKSFKITATDTITASASVTKVGYVKSADNATSAATTSTVDAYLAGYNGELNSDESQYVINNAFVVGSGEGSGTAIDSETILTAGKYLDKNITVSLHEDAMGSAVRAELASLERRLAGNFVTRISG